jgi:hypothetical protein
MKPKVHFCVIKTHIMKDIDIYILVTGLFLLSGFITSSGFGFLSGLLNQAEYSVYGALVFAATVGLIVYKLNQNKSSNN